MQFTSIAGSARAVSNAAIRRFSAGSIDPHQLASARSAAAGEGFRSSARSLFSWPGLRAPVLERRGSMLDVPTRRFRAAAQPQVLNGSGQAPAAQVHADRKQRPPENAEAVNRGRELVQQRIAAVGKDKVEAPVVARPIAVFGATGGIAGGVVLAILLKDPNAKVTLFSRNSEHVAKEGLRLEFIYEGKPMVFFLKKGEFPNVNWASYADARDARTLPLDSIVISGLSAANAPENLRANLPVRKVGEWSVLTCANGIGVADEIMSLFAGEGRQDQIHVTTGLAWFNSKFHPEGHPGRFVSYDGKMQVLTNPDDPSVAREIAQRAASIPVTPVSAEADGKASDGGKLELVRFQVVSAVDADREVFKKAAVNSALNPFGIIFEKKMQAMIETPGALKIMQKVCDEASAISRANGVDIGAGEDVMKYALGLLLGVTKHSDFHTSSHSPYADGEEVELDAVMGRFAKLATKHGIPAPYMEMLNESVTAIVTERRAKNADGSPKYSSHAQFLEKTQDMRTKHQERLLGWDEWTVAGLVLLAAASAVVLRAMSAEQAPLSAPPAARERQGSPS